MTPAKALKLTRYGVEALLVLPLFVLFALLPLDAASALGGAIGRVFGPLTAWHRRAERNLRLVFPEKTVKEQAHILRGMWDNLGRVLGEYPHMRRPKIASRIKVTGAEHIDASLRGGVPPLLVSGHFSNWEILPRAASDFGIPLQLVYRPANNPLMEWLLRRARAAYHGGMVAKEGALRSIMRALRERRPIGMLIDQKYNGGTAVPFFGIPAMTSHVVADLALKHGVPILPIYVERLGGAQFGVTVLPPLPVVTTGELQQDRQRVLGELHAILEGWVRARPEQWLWVHQRWPKEYYKNQ